ncbi:MAG: T9SS type A sorting domain-containing protein, partial [bacterium]|nr:T9SS type A sorting domain-containing protein [bacterium]
VFLLYQNYPNPAQARTCIKYGLPKVSKVSLKVYNVAGQEVCTLVDERQKAGYYTLQWDGRDNTNRTVACGVYFYRFEADDFKDTKKLILLR